MERVLSQEERIRRAEEIYYRRRGNTNTIKNSITTSDPTKRNFKLLEKIFLQVLVCMLIYLCIYLVQTNNYIFSKDFLGTTKNIVEYDYNFKEFFSNSYKYLNSMFNKKDEIKVPALTSEVLTNEAVTNEDNNENVTAITTESSAGKSQMEQDAEYIKNNFSFIKPIEGTITSRYGLRNPTTSTVPKNHTGIDIGANTGTVIVAAMEGTVERVSSEGDYGNHLKIVQKDVCTLYAHCNSIYVKQGNYIKQGQEIAEVGATGNVTGPHLHFEIRRNDEYVNPDLVMNF